tara:strand:+ start:156239 stop:156430 length:192 start_codon:yes stop_codon:yes gene_type:complete
MGRIRKLEQQHIKYPAVDKEYTEQKCHVNREINKNAFSIQKARNQEQGIQVERRYPEKVHDDI